MIVVNIVPTYNEKANIGIMLKTLGQIAKNTPNYKFLHLVVDDNSPDGTGKIVQKWMKKNKSIYLLAGPKKGLGTALLRGCKYAIEKLNADVVVLIDGDLSWDPYKIPQFLNKMEQNYDVVIASRHQDGGQSKGWSNFRKLNHWVSNTVFADLIAGIKEVKDHNANFIAIRVKGVLNKIPLDGLLQKTEIKGFAFIPYILYKLSLVTKKFYEMPEVFKFRTRGEAKISKKYLKIYLKDIVEYIKLCILIRLERWQKIFK